MDEEKKTDHRFRVSIERDRSADKSRDLPLLKSPGNRVHFQF